jgi:hypothetical protein
MHVAQARGRQRTGEDSEVTPFSIRPSSSSESLFALIVVFRNAIGCPAPSARPPVKRILPPDRFCNVALVTFGIRPVKFAARRHGTPLPIRKRIFAPKSTVPRFSTTSPRASIGPAMPYPPRSMSPRSVRSARRPGKRSARSSERKSASAR